MFLHDQPLALYLPVHVGYASNHVSFRSILAGELRFLNAVTVGNGADHRNIEVRYCERNRPRKCRKQVLPILLVILPTYVLTRRRDVEYEQSGAGRLNFHHGVQVFGD